MDVQDMCLSELSKTHSSLTGAGRERKGDGNSLYPPWSECPLSPPGIRTEVGFSPSLAHLRLQRTPGSPSECGSQNSSHQGTCEICKTKWEISYLHSRYEQAEDLYQGSTPSSPSIGPFLFSSFTSSLLRMSAQPAGRGEHKQSL